MQITRRRALTALAVTPVIITGTQVLVAAAPAAQAFETASIAMQEAIAAAFDGVEAEAVFYPDFTEQERLANAANGPKPEWIYEEQERLMDVAMDGVWDLAATPCLTMADCHAKAAALAALHEKAHVFEWFEGSDLCPLLMTSISADPTALDDEAGQEKAGETTSLPDAIASA